VLNVTKDNKFKKAWNGLNKAADKINPIVSKTADTFRKTSKTSNKAFNETARKTSEKLTDVSGRAAGQKKIKCPRCKSLDVSFLENDKKNFSIGKAVGGSILAGGVGSLAGFAGKKGKKNHWKCNECGTTFKK